MPTVSFAAFYLIWADIQGWEVPDFHILVCDFLQDYGILGLLMMPRGHGKSTMLDVYNAWKFYCNRQHMILHQGATDPDAYKVSRGTEQVLEKHPLTYDHKKERGELQKWWIKGCNDVRHGNLHVRGILSNVTGARAHEIQNDDVEVPGNISTPEAREKLRYRLSEQTHILIPGGQKLYVGTPHTHDSLYTRIKNMGAKCLIIKMFEHEARFEDQDELNLIIGFKPVYVFSGIGIFAKVLKAGEDFTVTQKGNLYYITLNQGHYLIDVYSEAIWPERFTPAVMEERRKECLTLNEWDSQYQLHAKPVGEIRLDPDKIIAYDCEPVIRVANKETLMFLGDVRIVSANLRVDPSAGKIHSDACTYALILQDENGRLYWHRSGALHGEIIKTNEQGDIVPGGQCWELCDIIEQFQLTRCTIETNGVGTHFPANLKQVLKKRRIRCGVSEEHVTQSKNRRILAAIEGPLKSGYLWAHISVLVDENDQDTVQVKQMREFNPAITVQPDDYIDSLAGAIADEPVRIGKTHNQPPPHERQSWRANGGTHEAALDFD